MSDTVGKPTVVKKSADTHNSAKEEKGESPAFEKVEDEHDETTQIKPGTARHAALMATWKAPSGGKVVKLGHKTGPPKATK